ncbi:MAG: hypothetical protein ACLSDJ_06040 [Butyricimonas faecihominis]
MENKTLMSKIELAQATINQNVDKIISLGTSKETKSEELWSIVNAIDQLGKSRSRAYRSIRR